MMRCAVIQPREPQIQVVHDLSRLLADPRGESGIVRFLGEDHLLAHPDPNYWQDGDAVLIRFEVVVPQEVTKEWRLP